jgi:predicted nucleic acid-binding protein
VATLIAVDSTVIVAGLVSWHERHESAAAALEAALARKSLVIPAPVLTESYSLLTRLPAQHRLTHADAFHLLRSSLATARIAASKTRDAWTALRRWSVAAIGGTDVFDLAVLEIAQEAGAKSLLTFRKAELERLAVPGVELVEPV